MRLSPRMKQVLQRQLKFESRPNVTLGRLYFGENVVTHEALLRRGLIHEANDEFRTTTLTEKGRKVAQTLAARDET